MSRQRQAILRVIALEEQKNTAKINEKDPQENAVVVEEAVTDAETSTTPETEVVAEQSVKKKFPFQKKKKSVPQE